MKKKLTRLASIFLLIISITMTSSVMTGCGPTQTQQDAYDNDAIIAKRDTSYLVNNINTTSTNESLYDFELFYGVKTISTVNLDGDKTFSINLEISEPKFKFVLVKGDEVITIIDESTDGQITITKDDIKKRNNTQLEGDYKLKMVGKNAKAKFEIKY